MKVILQGNRMYFTDEEKQYLFYFYYNEIYSKFDEVKNVDGVYPPRYKEIYERLLAQTTK